MTDHRQKAAEIRARFKSDLQRIRDNNDLSADGKVKRIAGVYRDARTQIDELRRTADEARQERIRKLERQLFSVEDDHQASYRDAVTRADTLGSEAEAQRTLERAHRTGDDVLAKAVAMVSTERGWTDALDTYVDKINPDATDTFNDLLAARREDQDKARRLSDSMTFNVQRPNELSAANDRDIAAMADST